MPSYKSSALFIAVVGILVSSSHAAMVAQFSSVFVTPGSNVIPAADYADHVTVSDFAPSTGGINRVGGGVNYDGWGTSVDLSRYVGFKISADPGYQLNLTDFAFRSASTTFPAVTSYAWGIRIDNGGGFGEWSFGKTYTQADSDFTLIGFQNVKSWDFADFSTTGTVEFGLFVAASDPTHLIEAFRSNSTMLNGSVTAVPEPSAAVLGLVGCTAFFRRRR